MRSLGVPFAGQGADTVACRFDARAFASRVELLQLGNGSGAVIKSG